MAGQELWALDKAAAGPVGPTRRKQGDYRPCPLIFCPCHPKTSLVGNQSARHFSGYTTQNSTCRGPEQWGRVGTGWTARGVSLALLPTHVNTAVVMMTVSACRLRTRPISIPCKPNSPAPSENKGRGLWGHPVWWRSQGPLLLTAGPLTSCSELRGQGLRPFGFVSSLCSTGPGTCHRARGSDALSRKERGRSVRLFSLNPKLFDSPSKPIQTDKNS